MELQKPRGTRDFLFDEMKERKFVENTMRKVFETYGYQEIKTPIFEDLALFTLKSGEGIIEEIYHFQDKGGRDLALRPELTAPVARIYLNQLQKAPRPIKMYYFGSCFRYERPQAGRFRQFWQFGCELIGGKSPDCEAEIIALAAHCLEELKLEDYQIHLGNLGILRGILTQDGVSADQQDQVMAIIDKGEVKELEKLLEELKLNEESKNILLELIGLQGHREVIPVVQELVKNYPDATKSMEELEELLVMLEAFGFTGYTVNLGIARGLDYYTGTVFEIYVEGLGAQKQISGGGTYNLIEIFGGEKVESTGFAFGFDRVMESLKIQKTQPALKSRVEVFVAPISTETKLKAFEIAQKLRKNNITTDVELVGRKLKKILSFADNSGAKFVVLVGARDLEEGKITLKDMESGDQEQIPIKNITSVLLDRIKTSE
ncbi:histidine--tRNA ligase [Methanobacterium petrolearium]|uniref:histidine--tRNA ligase n=1 Tax=Methanobacterium petrolearium TaxID=710190 RepID=UPI001AE95C3A|nr:histidine--tRNA ligase [Methanobacterium petrolearium]MBP1945735.1 histidyl-tRNA synthetase [Methanobacterium petrolearium]